MKGLGDRMKKYEEVTRNKLTPRTYTIIRIDGKAFHTYTRRLKKPFDRNLMYCMKKTMQTLCEEIQGAKFGYTQSDEISIVMTDFDKHETVPWFDRNVQKIVSVSASIATWTFNHFMEERGRRALFDSRVFTLPNRTEAVNYFIWRQADATRNSVSSLAQSLYSQNQLNRKSVSDMVEMIKDKGKDWDELGTDEKMGSGCVKQTYESEGTERSFWKIEEELPSFVTNRAYLESLIPTEEELAIKHVEQ